VSLQPPASAAATIRSEQADARKATVLAGKEVEVVARLRLPGVCGSVKRRRSAA
jgi:hypothetical protein